MLRKQMAYKSPIAPAVPNFNNKKDTKMKNGLIIENGEAIYYENDMPRHAGVVKIDGAIYYAGRGGRLATGYRVVHKSMANGLLKHGTYKFDDDGKLIEGLYIAPRKEKRKRKKGGKIRLSRESILAIVAGTVVVVAVLLFIGWRMDQKNKDQEGTAPASLAMQLQSLPDDRQRNITL